MHSSLPDTRASLIQRLPDAADAMAWNEVIDIYSPLIRRLAVSHGMQSADADDLTQEVFASVSQSIQRWLDREDRGPFRAWLLSIARNAAINHLTRRATKTLAAGGSRGDSEWLQRPSRQQEITDQFDVEFRKQVFRWAAARVKNQVAPKTWSAFWLTQIEGQSVENASRQLDVTVGAIYVNRSRVMKRMKESVKQYEVSL